MGKVLVESSNIKSVEYDEEEKILSVEFKNDSIYDYSNVPKNDYDNLINDVSKGKFIHCPRGLSDHH
ncbi:MAG: KTSC domain-containing protein [Nitrospinae bacterium]|nr:KTSC domain-containing protein [Nitrospinota bacterium]